MYRFKLLFRRLVVLSLMLFLGTVYAQEVTFPRAFAIAIDDIGWNQGRSLGNEGGPWRAGVRRDMNIKDYMPIVAIAKAAGVRLQGLFVLSEMDRTNVCAKYPTITKQGEKFDNSKNVNDEQIQIMNYVKDNAAYFEFGLHGVGHEHFENGVRTRAEWYDTDHHKPWPEQDSRDHLKCFIEIMAQYGFTKENGQSFPESYVPCAYGYWWNPDGAFSTGKLLSEAGVKYGNTLFEQVAELKPPIEFGGGFDHGLLMISRYNYGNDWYKVGALPVSPLSEYKSDIIETHWPNLLAQDYFLQDKLNEDWVAFFKNIQKDKDHYLAKNTEQLYSQWLYNHYAKAIITDRKVVIDNTNMPQVAYDRALLGNMVLKVKLNEGMHVSSATVNGQAIPAYFEEAGYGFLYLPVLQKKQYTVEFATGKTLPERFVDNTGTYNVYDVKSNKKEFSFDLKMYGTQDVLVKCEKPLTVKSDNPNVKIISQSYDQGTSMLKLEISGRDMQGERGVVKLTF